MRTRQVDSYTIKNFLNFYKPMKIFFFNESNKVRSIWWIPIFFLLLILFLFPTILIAQKYSVGVSIPIQAGIIITVTFICQLLRRESITVITGRLDLQWFRLFFVGLFIGAAMMIVPALILTVLGFARWETNELAISTLLSGLVVFIGVALAEELLFRGFLFQRLIESIGEWPAQLIIAGLFLLTHINNPGMIGMTKLLASFNIYIASILLGIAFIKTKSLATPLAIHFMANLMQGTILGYGVSGRNETSLFKAVSKNCPTWLNGGEFGLEASLLGLTAAIFITIYLYYNKNTD